jgi:hypothetical protein
VLLGAPECSEEEDAQSKAEVLRAERWPPPSVAAGFPGQPPAPATSTRHGSSAEEAGGNGVVYGGVIADGSTVAIKKSRVLDEKQLKEFSKEMRILSQINHMNAVKLLGCCVEVEVPMLVYQYVPNGSLHRYIHGGDGKGKAPMPPGERLRVAAESAHALAYMHSSASPRSCTATSTPQTSCSTASSQPRCPDFGAC